MRISDAAVRFAALAFGATALPACRNAGGSVEARGAADALTLTLADVRGLPPMTLEIPRFVANRVDAEAGVDYYLFGFDAERGFGATLVVSPGDERQRAHHGRCQDRRATVTSQRPIDGRDEVVCEGPGSWDTSVRLALPGGGDAYCRAGWTARRALDESDQRIAAALLAACRTIRFGDAPH